MRCMKRGVLSNVRTAVELCRTVRFMVMMISFGIQAGTQVVLMIRNLSALDELSFGEVPLLSMRHVL